MDSRSESPDSQPARVTVDLVAPGGVIHQLRQIGTNELCALEEQFGRTFGQLMTEVGVFGMEQMRLSTVRGFIKQALVSPLSDEQVGVLIDAVGFEGVSAAINRMVIPAQVGQQVEQPTRKQTAKGRTH